MKIALLGSAPSSVRLAPFSDPSWEIWACSPGTYSILPRCNAFFELHRWEPGVIGKPDTQKPWFSPEYVAWMGRQSLVWMFEPVVEIPNSRALPFEQLQRKWGSYFWTSSLSYMIAMALDKIMDARKSRAPGVAEEDVVGLWGVDMSATEEYGYQRAGCHHFLCLANLLGIGVYVPPESDLLRPMPPYGLFESTHFHIKSLARKNELESRLAGATAAHANTGNEVHFLKGCIDDIKYQLDTWGDDRQGIAPSPELAREMVAYGMPPAPVVNLEMTAAAASASLDAAPIPTRNRKVHDGAKLHSSKPRRKVAKKKRR